MQVSVLVARSSRTFFRKYFIPKGTVELLFSNIVSCTVYVPYQANEVLKNGLRSFPRHDALRVTLNYYLKGKISCHYS